MAGKVGASGLERKDHRGAAKAAGLRYVSDDLPGIRKQGYLPNRFWTGPDGRRIRDEATLKRIRALAIPPAWTDVWVCPDPRGHIQVTARDAKGRKQYRYHAAWREVRDETKYHRMLEFGKALPAIRARVERDLARPGLPKEKVLAAVVRLLEKTFIRVGNEEYAKENKHYGLTTMQDRHLRVKAGKVEFHFKAKSGVDHEVPLDDPRLAKVVKQCQALPGQDLLQYVGEDGAVRDIKSDDVNAYLQAISGEDYTAKDFRTWAGTVLAALALQELGTFETKAGAKKNIVAAIKRVSGRLGNTPSVCRKCYVHPEVINAYLDGELVQELARGLERVAREAKGKLRPDEAAVLALLRRRLAAERKARKSDVPARRIAVRGTAAARRSR